MNRREFVSALGAASVAVALPALPQVESVDVDTQQQWIEIGGVRYDVIDTGLTASIERVETTTFGSGAKESIAGAAKYGIDFIAYYDSTLESLLKQHKWVNELPIRVGLSLKQCEIVYSGIARCSCIGRLKLRDGSILLRGDMEFVGSAERHVN